MKMFSSPDLAQKMPLEESMLYLNHSLTHSLITHLLTCTCNLQCEQHQAFPHSIPIVSRAVYGYRKIKDTRLFWFVRGKRMIGISIFLLLRPLTWIILLC